MEKIKLVIWDLDDTFWKGTLSEGDIQPIQENILLVKKLVDRGIMNSIVSKNDFYVAKRKLEEIGIWSYFVFPQISWNSKGEIIKNLLDNIKLRDVNTVFIDDNQSNLNEAKFYNPGLNVFPPDFLNRDILTFNEFIGKNDENHTRLKQYKLLEEKNMESKKFSSNIEFLKSSEITISICNDCLEKIDRIIELVERTNQLNFTKRRDSKNDLIALINDRDYECRYIMAKDKFGSYGVVGFYAKKSNELVHFLFSCRILGMGIENYIYNKLNCPSLKVIPEVVTELKPCVIDWVTIKKTVEDDSVKANDNFLMISGCDLQQADFYLSSQFLIDKEFATVINGREIRTSDSYQLLNASNLDENEKKELCENIPFYDDSLTFKTKMFSGNYKVIIWSVVDDYIRASWRHKKNNYKITFGAYFDYENNLAVYKKDDLDYFYNNFDYEGKLSLSEFENNVRCILNKIKKSNPTTLVILINGIEVDVSDWIGFDRCNRNIEMNAVIDKIVSETEGVELLDMRKIVKDRTSLIKKDNRHFDRITYYKMAKDIADIFNHNFVGSKIKTRYFLVREFEKFIYSIINFCSRGGRKIYKILRNIKGK